jgi:hypothetical protein
MAKAVPARRFGLDIQPGERPLSECFAGSSPGANRESWTQR